MRDDGSCSLLAEDGLCELQRDHGASCLPAVCALYPRVVRQYGDRLEASALISCPEYARQLLLAADGATLEAFDPEQLPRQLAVDMSLERAGPYGRHFDDVRGAMLAVLDARRFGAAQRLFLLAFFAHRTRSFFHRGVGSEVDVADELRDQIGLITRAGAQSAIAAQQRGVPPSAQTGLAFVCDLLATAGRSNTTARFRTLVHEATQTYSEPPQHVGDPSSTTRSAQVVMWEKYRRRRSTICGTAQAPLDGAMLNRATDYVFSTPYVEADDLMQYVQRLLIELAVVRFLFFSQPTLDVIVDPRDQSMAPSLQRALIAENIVTVFSATHRCMHHDKRFSDSLFDLLGTYNLDSLAGCLFLLEI